MQDALRTLKIFVPITSSHTREFIIQKVDMVLAIPDFSHIDRDLFIRVVETEHNIRADEWTILENQARKAPWLNSRQARDSIKWKFWNRYYQ